MSKEGDLPKLPIKNRKIGTTGISLIVIGLSLLSIYILWASFGYIGPSFSSDVLNLQQSTLRAQYHLPEEPVVTDPAVLQTPPSLRQFLTDNATSSPTNATSSPTNATSSPTNATSSPTNATDQASGNTQVSIVPGASTLTDTAYSPNPVEVTVGQTVVWTNDDSAFHTVTSGPAGAADAGKVFDSGLTGPTALTSKGKTFEHTFDTAGEYPYFCTLHPAMVGTVMVN
ncbi:plastocyanin/azurin family copper-binding protein [Candidatus Nitrosocosmicus arcticus]|nr:plastocyanin/azurin family copper-binding protein [Candidatus Nitrosocosmicus arcticus]